MEIHPIAHFRSPFTTKFGIPRQSGIVPQLTGEIVFEAEYGAAEAVRGLEEFDYLWLIWGFSENIGARPRATVRPPRLGGNRHVGVFATRSSFRPNGLALSSVRIESIETGANGNTVIRVAGADLMDGTPIYDIKPYLAFVDSHPNARGGFVDTDEWHTLRVEYSTEAAALLTDEEQETLTAVLEQDPRPQYHDDPTRIYGMPYGQRDIRFRVEDDVLTVVEVVEYPQKKDDYFAE